MGYKAFMEEMLEEAINRLESIEGEEIYADELVETLISGELVDGNYVMYYDRAKNYIMRNWEAASMAVEYFRERGLEDAIANPFSDPCLFTVRMLEFGISETLNESLWAWDGDDEIEIDRAFIESVKVDRTRKLDRWRDDTYSDIPIDMKGHVPLATEGDMTLVYLPKSVQQFVIASDYDHESGEWAYGSYY